MEIELLKGKQTECCECVVVSKGRPAFLCRKIRMFKVEGVCICGHHLGTMIKSTILKSNGTGMGKFVTGGD